MFTKAIVVGEKIVDNLVDQKEMDVATFSNAAAGLRDFVLEKMDDVSFLDLIALI